METEIVKCRGCGKPLKYNRGSAYDPLTKKDAKTNHYGGFVCSYRCDFNSSLELEQSMPGHGYSQKTLGCFASDSLKRNWADED